MDTFKKKHLMRKKRCLKTFFLRMTGRKIVLLAMMKIFHKHEDVNCEI